MSAIDRAFIKAYSDEAINHVQQPPLPTQRSTAEDAAAMAASEATQPTSTAQPQRKTAMRTKRSAAAAAIRAAEPALSPAASPIHSEVEPADANRPGTPAMGMGANKPKMVVGRRALQQLAQAASVPSPHAAFKRQGQAADGHGGEVTVSPGIAVTARSGPQASVATAQTVNASRVQQREPVATSDATPQQLRVDRSANDTSVATGVLEVDHFVWPAGCNALIARAMADLESVAELLTDQAANGSQAIAILSIDEGDGGTTIALCLSRMLAKRGTRVCLMDGDCRRPGLAECLGLEMDRGLESVLDGDAALDDVLVESLADRITLMPLSRPLSAESVERSKLRQTVTFGELRDRFDAVLIDAGSVGVSPAHRPSLVETGSIDAVILVGRENSDATAWQRARRALDQWNVPCLGAIENRCVM